VAAALGARALRGVGGRGTGATTAAAFASPAWALELVGEGRCAGARLGRGSLVACRAVRISEPCHPLEGDREAVRLARVGPLTGGDIGGLTGIGELTMALDGDCDRSTVESSVGTSGGAQLRATGWIRAIGSRVLSTRSTSVSAPSTTGLRARGGGWRVREGASRRRVGGRRRARPPSGVRGASGEPDALMLPLQDEAPRCGT
jgi:hypothetical protein